MPYGSADAYEVQCQLKAKLVFRAAWLADMSIDDIRAEAGAGAITRGECIIEILCKEFGIPKRDLVKLAAAP